MNQNLNPNREIVQSLIERKVQNILDSTDTIISSLLPNNPAMKSIALAFVNGKKKEYLPQIQQQCDLLAETSCADPTLSLEESVQRAEEILNSYVGTLFESKFGVPSGAVAISLSTLFGKL